MEDKKGDIVFISYLQDNDRKVEGFFELVYLDSSIVKFKTRKHLIVLPTSRILTIKYNLKEEDK